MAHYLLLAYIVLYTLFSVAVGLVDFLVVLPDEKRDEKAWEAPVDIVLALAGLVGMLLLFKDVHHPLLKLAWKPISLGLLGAQAYLFIQGRITTLRSAGVQESERWVRQADVLTLVFLVPSLVFNLLYAFG